MLWSLVCMVVFRSACVMMSFVIIGLFIISLHHDYHLSLVANKIVGVSFTRLTVVWDAK